ncbi:hypothetical protein [Butyrivibrio sp. FCS014]|uniref:hypothetical protein n=1 Tax=Butyrivibrio sp. FCS014 TaxID=1408304 RepID=UPI00046525FA|nr:hypothetical protein [Butyrivibrio sp. FCS014]
MIPRFEEQKRRQASVFKDNVLIQDRNQRISSDFAEGRVDYEDSFIQSEVDLQQQFYRDYTEKWGHKSEGQQITPSNYVRPEEAVIHNQNLGYKDRYRRRKLATGFENLWNNKLNYLNQANHQEPIYGLKLSEKPGTYAFDIMKSTIRLGYIELSQKAIMEDAKQGAAVDPLFTKYEKEILSLAPPLVISGGDELTGNVQMTRASIEAFTAFIKKAMANPVEAIKDAALDALYSFGSIPENLLSEHAVPQKIDELKLLKDKYKAVAMLFEKKGSEDEITRAFLKMSKDKELVPRDNLEVAKYVYKSIDKDMRYAFEHYGVNFKNDGSLIDLENLDNAHIRKTGGQTKALLTGIKKNAKTEQITGADEYWDNQSKKLISKDDPDPDKPQKKVFKDSYNIAGSINALNKNSRSKVEGDGNKALFDQLCESGNKIALAISDIDKELSDAADIEERRKADLLLRPEMKGRVTKYLDKRRQQQLDLMDRAAGVINALKHLAGEGELDPNGNQVLRQQRYQEAEKKRKNRANGNNNNDNVENVVERDIFVLSMRTRTFADVRNALFEKFAQDPNIGVLRALLNSQDASKQFDLLTLDKVDLMNKSLDEVRAAFEQALSGNEAIALYENTILEVQETTKNLYDKLSKDGYSALSLKDRAELAEEFSKLRARRYALARLKTQKGIANSTFDALMKAGKSAQELLTLKNNEIVDNARFKALSDHMEMIRTRRLKAAARDGVLDINLLEGNEQLKVAALLEGKNGNASAASFFEKKETAARKTLIVHLGELSALTVRNEMAGNMLLGLGEYGPVLREERLDDEDDLEHEPPIEVEIKETDKKKMKRVTNSFNRLKEDVNLEGDPLVRKNKEAPLRRKSKMKLDE